MTVKNHKFDVKIDKILKLMINSLYSNKDVAIRELVSNAADACDKLRYLSLQDNKILKEEEKLKIEIFLDKKNKQISIKDNGIGMNEQELINNLGTIAKSGTEEFINSLTEDKKKNAELIGQFGVGFYASFMVAQNVEVISKKYDNDKTLKWTSVGDGSFDIDDSKESLDRGTKIILNLKDEDQDNFLDKLFVKNIISKYSDHISVSIELTSDEDKKEDKPEVINSSSAIWAKQKSEVTKKQYEEFYKNISHLPGEPFMTIHNHSEGTLEFSNLLFVPSMKPFDLYNQERKATGVKLYVKKIFISEDIELIPAWLRFIKGVVDSQDLPLNISRETLQHNIIIEKIKKAIVTKILSELKKKSSKEEEYLKFWENFGPVLKEGLCEYGEFKEKILDISRFYTSKSIDKPITLKQYLNNCSKDQDKIYYITGDSTDSIKNNPKLEGFIQNDIEVLFLTDPVDDFWVTSTNEYQKKEFQSINRSDIDLEKVAGKNSDKKDDKKSQEVEKDFEGLITYIKSILGDRIKDVKISKKLNSSPVCLAVDGMGMDIRMERFLKSQNQLQNTSAKLFEINSNHKIIKYLQDNITDKNLEAQNKNIVLSLYDQACIIEGEPILNPKEFSDRLNSLIEKTF